MWRTRVLLILILFACVAAGTVAVDRSRVERENRTVELVMDYPQLAALARQSGTPMGELLAKVREAGIITVALPETDLQELSSRGRVFIVTGADLRQRERLGGQLDVELRKLLVGGGIRMEPTYVLAPTGAEGLSPGIQRAITILQARFGPDQARELSVRGWTIVEVKQPIATVFEAGLGLSPALVHDARVAGLLVAPRLRNTPQVSADAAAGIVQTADHSHVVIYEGFEVLGFPDGIEATANAMEQEGLLFGLIEFVGQKGDRLLAKALRYQAVRVHSITEGEMAKITPQDAVSRYARAARERDVRVMYIRPFLDVTPKEELLATNLAYLQSLSGRLKSEDFRLGPAQPFRPLDGGRAVAFAIVVGVMAGAVLTWWEMLHRLFNLPRTGISRAIGGARSDRLIQGLYLLGPVLGLLGVLGFALLFLKGYTTAARQFMALVAATIFPTYAVLRMIPEQTIREQGTSAAEPVTRLGAVGRWLSATGFSIAGVLLLVGLLGETRFQLKVDQFIGVKLMHAIPPVLVLGFAWLWSWRRQKADGTAHEGSGTLVQLREIAGELWRLADQSVKIKHLAIGLVVMIAGVLYLQRTGNESGAVLGIEQEIRAWLEQALAVRPRTKEFLIGHPAMLLAVYYSLRGTLLERRAAVALFAVGTIGQLSLVNTFSHIHTPLAVSLVRTVYGLLLGAVIGSLLIWLWEQVKSRWAAAGSVDLAPRASHREGAGA